MIGTARRVERLAEAVGRTPLVRLREASEATGALVLGKLESRTPGGSLKDRAVWAAVQGALARGAVSEGGEIVTASAGNLGIATAAVAAAVGLRATVVVPEEAPPDYRRLVAGLGAAVLATPGREAMRGAIRAAREAARTRPDAYFLHPLEEVQAVAAYESMAQEVWDALGGRLDLFIAGIGTGATVSGAGRRLHSLGHVTVVGVEPARAAVLTDPGMPVRPHRLRGLGIGFVPPLLDRTQLDRVEAVQDEDALDTMFGLWTREGLLVGPSSGATVAVARRLAQPGQVVVAVLGDVGERHLDLGRGIPRDGA